MRTIPMCVKCSMLKTLPPIRNEVSHLCQNRILSAVVGDGFRGERQIENDVAVKHVHFIVNFDYALVFVEIRIGADG